MGEEEVQQDGKETIRYWKADGDQRVKCEHTQGPKLVKPISNPGGNFE